MCGSPVLLPRLIALLLLVACSATPLRRPKAVDAGGTSETFAPSDASGTSDSSRSSDASSPSETLGPSDAGGTSETFAPSHASGTSGPLGPGDASFACQNVLPGTCEPQGCGFPVDWASAQAPAAWCGSYTPPDTPLSLSLCHASNGYDQAVLTLVIGGEMFIVDRIFYVYDSSTGRFVQELYQRSPIGGPAVCWLGTSDGPTAPITDAPMPCPGPETALQPICSHLLADGGS
jgi:hypothetical protein